MKGFGGGMQGFVKQANQLQQKIKKLQEELEVREYQATSGGSAVTVVVTGANQEKNITINPDVVKSGDAEMLQDLILTATNEALKIAKETGNAEMEKVTGGFGIPGLF